MIYNTTRCFEFKPLIILKLVNIEYSLFKYFCRFSFFKVKFNFISRSLGNIADGKLSKLFTNCHVSWDTL